MSSTDDGVRPAAAAPHAPDRRWRWIALAIAGLVATTAGDMLAPDELSLSLGYVLAIAAGAWGGGLAWGLGCAALGAAGWGISYLAASDVISPPRVFLWNLAVEGGVFAIVAIAMARVRAGLLAQRTLTARLAVAHHALEREAEEVGRLQRQLLPAATPQLAGWTFDAHYATCTRAGGDYYDFFALPDGRLGILVADATGHGAPAAVLMAMTRVLLRGATEPLAPPEQVLERIGAQLSAALPAGWFVTAFYAVLDPSTGRLDYSLAGHDAPLVLREEGARIETLPLCGGLPLGPFPRTGYQAGSTTLEPGDTLVAFTDGVHEAMSRDGELYGMPRVLAALADAGSREPTRLRQRLLGGLERHRADAPLSDDLTLLLLHRASAPPA